jgi:hypothetical protein
MPTERKVTIAEFTQHLAAQKFSRRIDEVIVHHTWSPTAAQYKGLATIQGIRRYHMETRGWSDNGYHVMFAPNGDLWLCRPLARSGAHTLNRNARTIGVSFIANFDAEDPATYGGMAVGVAAVAALCKRWSLPTSAIRFHREFADKSCPGTRMDLAKFRAHVQAAMQGGTPMPVPDVDPWAEPYVERAKEEGLMVGGTDGKFRGREPLTRQEAAVVFIRLLDRFDLAQRVPPV